MPLFFRPPILGVSRPWVPEPCLWTSRRANLFWTQGSVRRLSAKLVFQCPAFGPAARLPASRAAVTAIYIPWSERARACNLTASSPWQNYTSAMLSYSCPAARSKTYRRVGLYIQHYPRVTNAVLNPFCTRINPSRLSVRYFVRSSLINSPGDSSRPI